MKRILWAAIAAIVLTGCMKPDDIKIHGIENVSVSGGLSAITVNLVVAIENSSNKNIKVSDAEFHLTDLQDREMAIVSVAEELIIPRKSMVELEVPIRVRITNPLVGLSLLKDIHSNAPRILVTGDAKVKIGGIKKKFEVYRLPLSRIISDIESNQVIVPANLQSI